MGAIQIAGIADGLEHGPDDDEGKMIEIVSRPRDGKAD
jgi:hypothetical protein